MLASLHDPGRVVVVGLLVSASAESRAIALLYHDAVGVHPVPRSTPSQDNAGVLISCGPRLAVLGAYGNVGFVCVLLRPGAFVLDASVFVSELVALEGVRPAATGADRDESAGSYRLQTGYALLVPGLVQIIARAPVEQEPAT